MRVLLPERPEAPARRSERAPPSPRSASQAKAARRLACSRSRAWSQTAASGPSPAVRRARPRRGTTRRGAADRRLSPAGRQPLLAELADRLQHRVARLAARIALVRTRLCSTREPRRSDRQRGGRRRFHRWAQQTLRRRRPSASAARACIRRRRRTEPERGLFGVVEQVVAPGDGVAHRLQACRLIARPAGQERQAARVRERPTGPATRPGDRWVTRAAANSIASGRPSRRWQIAPMVGSDSGVAAKSARGFAGALEEEAHGVGAQRLFRCDRSAHGGQ